ncbi:MAG: hypothetical protein Tsb002_37960 [Wenzhouxiangellaceae bacterium]
MNSFLKFSLVFLVITTSSLVWSSDRALTKSLQAINKCVAAYQELNNGKNIDDHDNVYVHAGKNITGVMFTKGNVGSFEPRSEDYNLVMSCGVNISNDYEIYYLGSPMSDPLIDVSNEGIDSDLYKDCIIEIQYQNENGNYKMKNIGILDIDKLN